MKKVLNTTVHKRNATQNYNELSSQTYQNGYHQKDKKKKVFTRIWRKGNSCALLVRVQVGAVTMENSMKVSQELKKKIPYNPPIPLLSIHPKKMKSGYQKDMTTMFIASLFITDKIYLCVCSVAQRCQTLCVLSTGHTRLLCTWAFPGRNTGVGCHFLLQGILWTQGWNPHLLHCRWIPYCWATREVHAYIYVNIIQPWEGR